jgi:hypothetical protein
MSYRIRFLCTFILIFIIVPTSFALEVKRPSFHFLLPPDWHVLKQGQDKNFWIIDFSDEYSDVIQLSVTKSLTSSEFQNARKRLKSHMGHDKSNEGWKLLRSGTISIQPFGQVDEEIFLATQGDLISATYNLYGNNSIAVFTFTVSRNDPNISHVARKLLLGFSWNKLSTHIYPNGH